MLGVWDFWSSNVIIGLRRFSNEWEGDLGDYDVMLGVNLSTGFAAENTGDGFLIDLVEGVSL